jgi:hypothetical protein
MTDTYTTRVVVEGEDHTEPMTRELSRRMSEVGGTIEKAMTGRTRDTENRVQEHTRHIAHMYHEMATETSENLSKLLLGAGIEEGMRRSFEKFAEFERVQTRVGISTGASASSIHNLSRQVEDLAAKTGASSGKLLELFDEFKEKAGMSFEVAQKAFGQIVDASHAAGTSVENVMQAAISAIHNLGVTAEELPKVLNAWHTSVPQAMYEPFANVAPRISETLATLGFTGEKTARELGAIFTQMGTSLGEPRRAAMALEAVMNNIGNLGSKLGMLILPQLQSIRESGGGMIEVFKAIHENLDKIGYWTADPLHQARMRKMFDIDPASIKAIDIVKRNYHEIEESMHKGLTATEAIEKALKRLGNDSQASIDQITAAFDGLAKSVGKFLVDVMKLPEVMKLMTLAMKALTDAVPWSKGPSEEESQKNTEDWIKTQERLKNRFGPSILDQGAAQREKNQEEIAKQRLRDKIESGELNRPEDDPWYREPYTPDPNYVPPNRSPPKADKPAETHAPAHKPEGRGVHSETPYVAPHPGPPPRPQQPPMRMPTPQAPHLRPREEPQAPPKPAPSHGALEGARFASNDDWFNVEPKKQPDRGNFEPDADRPDEGDDQFSDRGGQPGGFDAAAWRREMEKPLRLNIEAPGVHRPTRRAAARQKEGWLQNDSARMARYDSFADIGFA